jgi:hypothetical protein
MVVTTIVENPAAFRSDRMLTRIWVITLPRSRYGQSFAKPRKALADLCSFPASGNRVEPAAGRYALHIETHFVVLVLGPIIANCVRLVEHVAVLR